MWARPLQFDISKYLCDMVHTSIPRSDGTACTFPDSARKLSNWRISSFSMGLETSDVVVDPASKQTAAGSVAISFQMSDVHLRKYPTVKPALLDCTFLAALTLSPKKRSQTPQTREERSL